MILTQNRAICSHDLTRLSRSPLIRSHDGSAAAAATHKSAAPPAHGVLDPGPTSLRRASAKLNGRAAALAGPPAPTGSYRLLVRLLPPGRLWAHPQSSIQPGDPQSSICRYLQSSILNPHSTILQISAILNPQSSILNPPCARWRGGDSPQASSIIIRRATRPRAVLDIDIVPIHFFPRIIFPHFSEEID